MPYYAKNKKLRKAYTVIIDDVINASDDAPIKNGHSTLYMSGSSLMRSFFIKLLVGKNTLFIRGTREFEKKFDTTP